MAPRGCFWARLCISDICGMSCDEEILKTLKNLPPSLAELFDSKILRIKQGKESTLAMNLLRYCGVVKRPLTIEEYREALSVSPGDKALNTKRLPNNINRVVRGCLGLTLVDDEEFTVHYVHHSVKEHLFLSGNKKTRKFNIKSINEQFGCLCMTYLNFADFSRQVTKIEKPIIDPLYFGTSSLPPINSEINRITQKLLSLRKERAPGAKVSQIQRTALESTGDSKHHEDHANYSIQNGVSLAYVKDYWLLHLKEIGTDLELWTLFCKCIEDRSLPSSWPRDLPVSMSPGHDKKRSGTQIFFSELSVTFGRDEQELAWILKHNHYALLLYFTTVKKLDRRKPIQWFPSFDDGTSYRWVEVLIELPAFTTAWGKALSRVTFDKGLHQSGKLDILLTLLRKMEKFNADATRLALEMVLRSTISFVQEFKLLLSVDKAFYPKIRVVDNGLHTAKATTYVGQNFQGDKNPLLIVALLKRLDSVVAEILKSGATANVFAQGSHDTALHLAADRGKTALVDKLLRASAMVNATNGKGETALHRSTTQRHSEVVEHLVLFGADVNLQVSRGDRATALHIAAEKRLLPIVKMLIDASANINL